MVRVIIFATLIAVALMIYTVIECARAQSHQVRSLPKAAWIVVIILLPLIGAGLWFALGRPQSNAASSPAPHSMAPDDDEDFLRQLEVWRRQQQREADLNAREQELKKREAESRRQTDSTGHESKKKPNGDSAEDATENKPDA